jgi:hypothetical protein
MNRRQLLSLIGVGLLALWLPLASPRAQAATPDPLPSWNDGAPKQAILDFVGRVTRKGGPDFVSSSPPRSGSPPLTMTAHCGPSSRSTFRSPSPSTRSSASRPHGQHGRTRSRSDPSSQGT